MSLLARLFPRRDDQARVRPLYASLVAKARHPHWYIEGGVADTIDGRFDMLAAILAITLLRLEDLDAKAESVALTELFVEDMDGQVRQIGFGDLVVGKQIGAMMSALGGRLGAYRDGLAPGGALRPALLRNIFRDVDPGEAAMAHVERHFRDFAAGLGEMDLPRLLDFVQRD
jgi:cytochrome b pre-mRNA-processing protein 3